MNLGVLLGGRGAAILCDEFRVISGGREDCRSTGDLEF